MPETYVDKKGFLRIKGTNQLFTKWAAENLRKSRKQVGPSRLDSAEQISKKRHWENPEDRSF